MSGEREVKRVSQQPMFFDEVDDIIEQSEERTSDVLEQKLESQIKLGWDTFQKEKVELQKLKKDLMSLYIDYRHNLVQSIKEFCNQTNKQYDYTPMMAQQIDLEKKKEDIAELKFERPDEDEEKAHMMEKILFQRRVKKYYKNRYEIKFQDQLDPEDDHKQIYQYYEQIFGAKHLEQHQQQFQSQPQQSHPSIIAGSRMKMQAPFQPIVVPVNEMSYFSNAIHPNSDRHGQTLEAKIEDPFQKMAFQTNLQNRNSNVRQVKDALMRQDLSFDGRNEYKMPDTGREESFHFDLSDRNDVMSEGGFNVKHKHSKSSDKMSHKDNIYKNYISKQNEQLELQKLKVQQLTAKALKVLNNENVEEQELREDDHEHHHDEEIDKMGQFKFLLGELIEVFSVVECLKFQLKFKSFELINKLYQHASEYYGEEIVFEQPLSVKYMSQIISAVMPEHDEESIRVIIQKIFQKQSQISYDTFVESLTSSINDHMFKILQETSISSFSNSTLELTVRLFDAWIEQDYFSKSIKQFLRDYPNITERFLVAVTEDAIFIPSLVCDFAFKGKKNKSKKLKVQIFLKDISGERLESSQFYRWIEIRKIALNQSFEKIKQEEKYEYYYNLY